MGSMMHFFTKHPAVRMALMIAFFVAGVALILIGWSMTGTLAGVGVMLLGLALLLLTLYIYNKPFQDAPINK